MVPQRSEGGRLNLILGLRILEFTPRKRPKNSLISFILISREFRFLRLSRQAQFAVDKVKIRPLVSTTYFDYTTISNPFSVSCEHLGE